MERIELAKSDRERISNFAVKDRFYTKRIPELAWEEKSFVYLDIPGHSASLLTRKVETFCLPTLIGFNINPEISYSDTYIFAWKMLRERGFNVVPSVRKVDNETVATTDLSADGSGIYDSKIDRVLGRDTQDTDLEFTKIKIDLIANQAYKLLEKANKNGVELQPDGPFHIRIKKGTSWDLISLDIGKIRIHLRPKDMTDASKNDNRFYVEKSLRNFSEAQNNIASIRAAWGI